MARKKTRPLIEDFDFIPAKSLVPENEQPYTIPRHWKWVRLGSLVQVVRGVTYKKHQVVDPSSSEAVLIVRGGNITDGHVRETQSDVFVSSTLVNDEQILQRNDLVVVASSGSKLAVGKAGVFEGVAFPCAAGGFTFLVRAAQYMRPEFLHLYFLSDEFKKRIETLATGININNVRMSHITDAPFPLPPLEEQEQIIKHLKTHTHKIDDAIQRLDSFLDNLSDRKVGIARTLLAGHGVSNEGNVHDIVWETKSLGEIIRVSSGKGLTAKEMAPGGNVPVYGGNGVTGYHDQSCYPAETITIGRVGFYCGSVHMTNEECWVTDNALVVRFNEDEIDKKFLYFLLLHTNLRKNTSSSAQPLISGKKIYDILVRIPALDFQKVIAEGIENSLEKLDKIQHSVEGSKQILVQLREQLIHHALMGKVQ